MMNSKRKFEKLEEIIEEEKGLISKHRRVQNEVKQDIEQFLSKQGISIADFASGVVQACFPLEYAHDTRSKEVLVIVTETLAQYLFTVLGGFGDLLRLESFWQSLVDVLSSFSLVNEWSATYYGDFGSGRNVTLDDFYEVIKVLKEAMKERPFHEDFELYEENVIVKISKFVRKDIFAKVEQQLLVKQEIHSKYTQ